MSSADFLTLVDNGLIRLPNMACSKNGTRSGWISAFWTSATAFCQSLVLTFHSSVSTNSAVCLTASMPFSKTLSAVAVSLGSIRRTRPLIALFSLVDKPFLVSSLSISPRTKVKASAESLRSCRTSAVFAFCSASFASLRAFCSSSLICALRAASSRCSRLRALVSAASARCFSSCSVRAMRAFSVASRTPARYARRSAGVTCCGSKGSSLSTRSCNSDSLSSMPASRLLSTLPISFAASSASSSALGFSALGFLAGVVTSTSTPNSASMMSRNKPADSDLGSATSIVLMSLSRSISICLSP